MIQNTLDFQADKASARYALLTDSWQGLFANALNQDDFGTSANTYRLIKEATDMANMYLSEEVKHSGEIFREIALEAHLKTWKDIASNDAEALTDQVGEHLEAAQTYILEEMFAQVRRDLSNMRQMLQRVIFEVSIAQRSRGISKRQAMIEYRLGNNSSLEFAFHDRGNRKWSSRKFVRTLWRHTMLSIYNEVVMLTLADHGIKHAIVQHLDVNAESHDTVIAFGSNSEYPTYSEIRDVVFHPNSNAVLAVESFNVSA